jgi:hypothetical protein
VAKTYVVAEKSPKILEGKTSDAVETEINPHTDLDYTPPKADPPQHNH